ncbi:transposase family protein [Nonomuraea sp. NPDC050643]|uniref:transposase family protein n=1 Tax=Nonomuraea sp. NPDC050643 TaxID=3155660 RepID=UPI00340558D9
MVRSLDPALVMLAHEGAKRYGQVFDLVHRREADRPNQIWQADHTLLDLWMIAPSGKPTRPWPTVIEDDHSRAIAGYAVSLEAPSALTTALVLRQAIWRKSDPAWNVCGIPEVLYTDYGSDFTSTHPERVMADLHIQAVFSLPGYAPDRSKSRAAQARLSLAELDEAIGPFIRHTYNLTPHRQTGMTPQQRWDRAASLAAPLGKPSGRSCSRMVAALRGSRALRPGKSQRACGSVAVFMFARDSANWRSSLSEARGGSGSRRASRVSEQPSATTARPRYQGRAAVAATLGVTSDLLAHRSVRSPAARDDRARLLGRDQPYETAHLVVFQPGPVAARHRVHHGNHDRVSRRHLELPLGHQDLEGNHL